MDLIGNSLQKSNEMIIYGNVIFSCFLNMLTAAAWKISRRNEFQITKLVFPVTYTWELIRCNNFFLVYLWLLIKGIVAAKGVNIG